MRRFGAGYAISAIKHALDGGQAVHVFPADDRFRAQAPAPFQAADTWGRLFDQNRGRLQATAKALGLTRPRIRRSGTLAQHIDLCGEPLQKAIDICRAKARE